MKPIDNLVEWANELRRTRLNMPKVTLKKAQAQAQRVMKAITKKSGDGQYFRSFPKTRKDFEKQLAETIRDMTALDGCWQKKLEKAQNEIEALHLQYLDDYNKWEELVRTCCNHEDELRHIDSVLSRRSALDNQKTRIAKILHAINVASSADAYSVQLQAEKLAKTRTVADYESRIALLLRELNAEKENNRHANEIVKGQNGSIEQAKIVIDTLKTENDNLLDAKVNAEHLARKVIELNQENNRLTDENIRFQEQVSRLVTENSVLLCPYQKTKAGKPCGKCIKCKLDAVNENLNLTNTNAHRLEIENDKINNQYSNCKFLYDNLLKLFKQKELESQYLNEIIRVQSNALTKITKPYSLFFRKGIANLALKAVKMTINPIRNCHE